MKRLSDYKDAEAIEIWADIFDPCMKVLSDEEVAKYTGGTDANIQKAAVTIIKKYPDEVLQMLTRIDDTPVNGANAFVRLVSFLTELLTGDQTSPLSSASQTGKKAKKSSGLRMENTGGGEK